MELRKLLSGIVLIFVFSGIQAQSNYTVIKVFGGIQYKATKKNMNQGDVFSPAEQLIFSNTESKAAVINQEKGRFILAPPVSGKLESTPYFIPAMGNIASRGGTISNMISLENHFKGKYLIINRVSVKISEKAFPMNDTAFFFLRYIYKGEEINKKLPFKGDSLIIDRAGLLTVDGRPIPNPDVSEMKLFYLSGKKSTFISEFEPVFPDTGELEKEIQIIVNEYKGKGYDQLLDEVLGYLNEFYGKPDKENVEQWLKQTFNL